MLFVSDKAQHTDKALLNYYPVAVKTNFLPCMSAEPKRKRTASSFKKDWLDETVITATPTSHDDQRVYLRDVFVYDENENTITCLYCHDAMVSGEFSSGKK